MQTIIVWVLALSTICSALAVGPPHLDCKPFHHAITECSPEYVNVAQQYSLWCGSCCFGLDDVDVGYLYHPFSPYINANVTAGYRLQYDLTGLFAPDNGNTLQSAMQAFDLTVPVDQFWGGRVDCPGDRAARIQDGSRWSDGKTCGGLVPGDAFNDIVQGTGNITHGGFVQGGNSTHGGFVQGGNSTHGGFLQGTGNTTRGGFIQGGNSTHGGFLQGGNSTHGGFIQGGNSTHGGFVQGNGVGFGQANKRWGNTYAERNRAGDCQTWWSNWYDDSSCFQKVIASYLGGSSYTFTDSANGGPCLAPHTDFLPNLVNGTQPTSYTLDKCQSNMNWCSCCYETTSFSLFQSWEFVAGPGATIVASSSYGTGSASD